jgi:hypothetical protein
MPPAEWQKVLTFGDHAKVWMTQLARDAALPDVARANALGLLVLLALHGSRKHDKLVAETILHLMASSRLPIREAALWTAISLLQFQERAWIRHRLSREIVERQVERARQLGLRKATRKRLGTHFTPPKRRRGSRWRGQFVSDCQEPAYSDPPGVGLTDPPGSGHCDPPVFGLN